VLGGVLLGTLLPAGGTTALVIGIVLAGALGSEVVDVAGVAPSAGRTVACADAAALAGGVVGCRGGTVDTTAHIASGAKAIAKMPGKTHRGNFRRPES
jgi:hypothetical protein